MHSVTKFHMTRKVPDFARNLTYYFEIIQVNLSTKAVKYKSDSRFSGQVNLLDLELSFLRAFQKCT